MSEVSEPENSGDDRGVKAFLRKYISVPHWSKKSWFAGFIIAVLFFALAITLAALFLAVPSWNASSQAKGCLEDSRSEYVALIDELPTSEEQEYAKGRWNAIASIADNPDNFFDPVGYDPLYTGDKVCTMVDNAVADLDEQVNG